MFSVYFNEGEHPRDAIIDKQKQTDSYKKKFVGRTEIKLKKINNQPCWLNNFIKYITKYIIV